MTARLGNFVLIFVILFDSVTAKMRESQAIADDKIVTEKRSSTLAVTSTKSKSAAHLRSTGSSLRSRRKKPKPQSAGSIRNVSKRSEYENSYYLLCYWVVITF